jgi:hypothetical protein
MLAWGIAPGMRLRQEQALKARFQLGWKIEMASKVKRAFSAGEFFFIS